MIALLKYLFHLATGLYFRSVKVTGKENIPSNGSVLFAANHPSAFMDPVLITLHATRKVHYLARGESFKHPIANWLFTKLRMIPIYRASSSPDQMHKNAAVFKQCYEHLNNDHSILIFPEGVSLNEPRLQPLKTGAARIVLGAAKEVGFEKAAKIVPVGINYSSQHNFQGHVLLTFGEPIDVDDYREQFIKDEKTAVRELTDELSFRLSGMLRNIDSSQLEELVGKVEHLYRSHLRGTTSNEGSLAEQNLALSQQLIEGLNYFQERQPYRLTLLADKIRQYEEALNVNKVKDSFFKHGTHVKSYVWTTLALLLGVPLFILGWVVNYPAYRLSGWVATKVVKDDQFQGSMKLTLGMLVFLTSYLAQSFLVSLVFRWQIGLAFLILAYPLGILTMGYARLFIRYKDGLRHLKTVTNDPSSITKLVVQRQEIITELEDGRKEFQSAISR